MMKLFWRLFFGKPAKEEKPKKKKKSLTAVLMDWLLSLPLVALKNKWNSDLWKPDF